MAEDTGTTEIGIYRYFENKHRLLVSQQRLSYGVVRWPRTFVVPVYIISWYWGWLEYQISFQNNNVTNPTIRLKKVIKLLATTVEDDEKTIHVK